MHKENWTKTVYSFRLVGPHALHSHSSDVLYGYWLRHHLGFQSKELIVSSKLNLGDVDQYPTIDVTFDGADESVKIYIFNLHAR